VARIALFTHIMATLEGKAKAKNEIKIEFGMI
jgi:hypothetical protein